MAVHYPADHNVFALVQCEDKTTLPKDKGIIKKVEKRIGREFVGTPEDNRTIEVVLNLEQKIGQEIHWVTGPTFDEIIRERSAIPNQQKRFCTTMMKMMPIFEWWYHNIGEVVKMGIGFRLDEFERSEKFSETINYRCSQNIFGDKQYKWYKGIYKEPLKWRNGWFPLIDDGVTHKPIADYWKELGWEFPNSSNCNMCFWKQEQELRQNWEENPAIMRWAARKEQEQGHTFRDELSMTQIKQIGLQESMFFGGGSCQADGYCSD